MEKVLKEYLEKNKIEYLLHEHEAVFTVAESKKLKGKRTGKHTKSLFLKDDSKNFYLICMEAEKRLDTKLLKEKLNVKKLIFASPEELKEHLNVTPGNVSIFCMLYTKRAVLIHQAFAVCVNS